MHFYEGGDEVTVKNLYFQMTAGESKYLLDTVTDVADLTGSTIQFAIKKHKTDATYSLFKSSTDGSITIPSAALNQFQVELIPADTKDFDGDYFFEANVID